MPTNSLALFLNSENKIVSFFLIFGTFFLVRQFIYKVVLPFAANPGLKVEKNTPKKQRDKVALLFLGFMVLVSGVTLATMYLKPLSYVEIAADMRSCRGEKEVNYKTQYKDMTLEEAITIGRESDCQLYGKLETKNSTCNSDAGEWWVTINETKPTEGCSRSCVVDVYEKAAVVNYQCGV